MENLSLKYDYFVLFTTSVVLQISGDLTRSGRMTLNGNYKINGILTWDALSG